MSKENVNVHNLGVGSRVLTGKDFDKKGVIKFVGPTTFSDVEGDWIGICLDTPDGRNNGSHSGVVYFEADENHGLFVKNWHQVRPLGGDGSEKAVASKSTVRSIPTASSLRDKSTSNTKTETESKFSSSAAITANKEKLAALKEKRIAAASAAATTTTPVRPSQVTLKSETVVPATPKRASLEASRNDIKSTEGGLTKFPSMCAQDLLEVKTPVGKENPLIEMMQASIYKLTKQEDEYAAQITEQNITIHTLRQEGVANAKQISELTSSLENAVSAQALMTTEMNLLRESLAIAEAVVIEKTTIIQESEEKYSKEIESLTEQNMAVTEQLQSLRDSISQDTAAADLQSIIDALRMSEISLTKEVSELKNTVSNLEIQRASTQEQLLQSQNNEESLRVSVNGLQEQLLHAESTASTSLTDSQAELAHAKQEIVDILERERTHIAELTSLRASLHALTESDSSGLCVELEHTIVELRVREEESSRKISELQTRNNDQMSELSALQATVSRLSTDIETRDSVSSELRSSIDDLHAKLVVAESKSSKLQDVVDQHVSENETLRSTVAQMQQVNDDLHNVNSDMQAKEEHYRSDIEQLESELNALKAQLETSADSSVNALELQRTVDQLQIVESEWKKKFASLQETLAERESQLATQSSQLLELIDNEKINMETITNLQNRLAETADVETSHIESDELKDLRVQVEDLTHSVEELTMDKEQLLMDNELLEEKVLTLQQDIEAAAGGSGDGENALPVHVANEIRRLQSTLNELQVQSAEDKELISTQSALLEELELECGELRAHKDQSAESFAEMQSAVDGMSSYEEMIERLTEQNLELSEQLSLARQSVSDLEEAVELNEELDARQTQQIADDARLIDSLNVTISGYDRMISEKDNAAAELAKQIDRLKNLNKTLQQEVQLLKDTIQLESLENRSIESKLRDVSLMKSQQEMLAQEITVLYNQFLLSNAQKFRYQSLFVRMDAIFGSSSFYLEESKIVNTELVFVSSLTTGLDACRQMSLLVSNVFDGKVADELQECSARNISKYVSLYLLLLEAQYYVIQSTVNVFRDGEDTAELSRVQTLMNVKALFERVVRNVLKMTELNNKLVSKSSTARNDAINANLSAITSSEGDAVDNSLEVTVSSSELQQESAYNELVLALTDIHEELQLIARGVGGSEADASFGVDSSSAPVPASQVELSLLNLNLLCDFATFQQQQIQKISVEEEETDSAKRDETVKSSFTLMELIKSVKVELRSAMFSLKHNTAHFVQSLSDLQDSCTILREAVLTNADAQSNVQSNIKSVLTIVRGVNSACTASKSSNSNITVLGVSGIFRYFPLILMTNIVTSLGAQRQQEEASLREQFNQHSEKYWNLLIQNSSDLLSTPQNQNNEVSWKARVAELRKIVSGRLGVAPTAVTPKLEGGGEGSGKSVKRGESFFQPQQEMVPADKLDEVVQELDVKKDELKSALRRCQELEIINQTAVSASIAASEVSHKEEIARLRDEMRVMEEALKSTENRAEAVEKEVRLARGGLHSQSVAAMVVPGKTESASSTARTERLSRRQSQGDVLSGAATGTANATLSSLLASVGGGPTLVNPASSSHSQSVADFNNQMQYLRDQVTHWRRVAMKRLTDSLVPLPDMDVPPVTRSSVELPVNYAPGNTVQQPNLFRLNNMEFVDVDKNTATSADYIALYRKIRLLRASGVQVKDIVSEAKKPHAREESKAEMLRARIKAKANIVYRIPHCGQ